MRARVETVTYGQRRSVQNRLVFELPSAFTPRCVRYVKGEVVVFNHARHIQVFDTDFGMILCQSRRELMNEIVSDVFDPAMLARQFNRGLAAIGRFQPLARMPATETTQFAERLFQRTRRVDLLSGRERGKRRQAEINTN
jgi:hypothetical protein